MKKKDIDLSMLEHAGNDIIDELVPFSSESERIKKRAFSMRKRSSGICRRILKAAAIIL